MNCNHDLSSFGLYVTVTHHDWSMTMAYVYDYDHGQYYIDENINNYDCGYDCACEYNLVVIAVDTFIVWIVPITVPVLVPTI